MCLKRKAVAVVVIAVVIVIVVAPLAAADVLSRYLLTYLYVYS